VEKVNAKKIELTAILLGNEVSVLNTTPEDINQNSPRPVGEKDEVRGRWLRLYWE
jgi:hypothetical protein